MAKTMFTFLCLDRAGKKSRPKNCHLFCLLRRNKSDYSIYPMFWVKSNDKDVRLSEKWNDLHPGSLRGALWQLWGLPKHPEQQLQGEDPPRCQWSPHHHNHHQHHHHHDHHHLPTITITIDNHHWLDPCCHLQPKLSNSSPGSVAVAALLTCIVTWTDQQNIWQVRLAWTSLALDQLQEAFHEIFTWFPSLNLFEEKEIQQV